MNYLKIINHFGDNAPYQEGYRSQHCALFYSVVRMINKNNWRRTKIDLGQILCISGLSKPTYIEARKWLDTNNWIEVVEGKNAYQMAEFFLGSEVRIEDIVEDNIFTSTDTSTLSSTDTSTIPSTLPINNKHINSKQLNKEIEIPIEGEKENITPVPQKVVKKLPVYTEDFQGFWVLYDKPTAGNKQKCFELWKKIEAEERRKIMSHVEFYKKVQPDSKYRKDPERYFTHRLWEDFNTNPEPKPTPKNERIDTRILFGEPA